MPAADTGFFVITGGPGSGKTTLVEALRRAGYACSVEAGRAIIQDQVARGGRALPWIDPAAFAQMDVEIQSTLLRERLDSLAVRLGKDRIRLSLPPLTRAWEERGLVQKIDSLRSAGWSKWEIGNASGWSYLGIDPVSLEDFRPYFDELIESRAFYVVVRDGDVRGFYRVTRHKARSGHGALLTTLAIAPAEKSSGLAVAMMEEAIDTLRAKMDVLTKT